MKKLIIFDADGVLLNSFHVAIENYNLLSSKYNLPKANNVKDFDFIFAGYLKTSLRKFGLSDELALNFFDEHSNLMKNSFHRIDPFFAVLKYLSQYRNKYTYAIVSSAYTCSIKEILRKSEYYDDNLFIDILGREVKLPKSQKIEQIRKNHVNSIYICDMVSDILYCKDINIDIGVVAYGYNTLSFLNSFNPNVVIHNEEDICNFLENF